MAWTSKIAFLACALIVISCAYILYELNGESLDLTDRELVLVVSDSMDGDVEQYEIDSFPSGTLVMVEHIPEHEKRFLRVGDVISYHVRDTLFHHRIFEIDTDSVYVQGDNNHSVEKILFSDVNGKVVGTNSVLGNIMLSISSNFYLFIGAMFVICSALILCGVYLPAKAKREVDYYEI